jgi:hypothetical protein
MPTTIVSVLCEDLAYKPKGVKFTAKKFYEIDSSIIKHYRFVIYGKYRDFIVNYLLSIAFAIFNPFFASTNTLAYYKICTLQICQVL